MDWLWWALAALAAALIVAPLAFRRLLWPGLKFLTGRVGLGLGPMADRVRPGLFCRVLVRVGNRYFRRRFAAVPPAERLLFLPYCLRPSFCPADIEPERGLACPGDCPGCELGRIRDEALAMGYGDVYVVASSRLTRLEGLLPSREFIKEKLARHQPLAALGVVCARQLQGRLLPDGGLGAGGYSDREETPASALQGLLLSKANCRRAEVDWQRLRRLMALGVGPTP